jgi:hypothetical protein
MMKSWGRTRSSTVDLEGVVREIATILKRYRCSTVFGDRYSAGWIVERFKAEGLRYEVPEYKMPGDSDLSIWTRPRPTSRQRNLSTRMRHGVREFTVAGSAHSSRRTGSVNVNVEPCPTWLFTPIRPPWSSMNFRESASPRPVPSTFLSAVPTCRNSSKTAS